MFDKTLNSVDVYKRSKTCRKVTARELVRRNVRWFHQHNKHYYTCQLFLRYEREIFILGMLGFLKTTRSFPKIPEEVRRSLPKTSEVCRRRSFHLLFTSKSEISRKVLSFIHFTRGFRSLDGSELTHFWKLWQARRKQLTFFNQAWEIGPQARADVRSKFSTRRRESWQCNLHTKIYQPYACVATQRQHLSNSFSSLPKIQIKVACCKRWC